MKTLKTSAPYAESLLYFKTIEHLLLKSLICQLGAKIDLFGKTF